MAKRPTYDDEFRANAVLMLQAAGYPDTEGALKRTAAHLRIQPRTLSRWARGEQNPPPDQVVNRKRVDLKDAIRDELANLFPAMAGARIEASYRDLATSAGILIDKLQLLEGKPTERIERIERLLNELPEDEYNAVIAEAEEVIAESRRGHSGSASPADG